jgi:hypothetical protein
MSVLLAAAAALLLGGCQNPFARSSSSLADRDEPPRRERMADRETSLEGQRPEDVAERFARGRQPSLGFDEGG